MPPHAPQPPDPAEVLNQRLEAAHPVAAACLSPLGRRLYFPKGIPAQAADARGTELNATIGQITDARRAPMPLRAMARRLNDVDPCRAFLYPPVSGFPELREAWAERLARRGPMPRGARPLVTSGLTHGLSICADLFADEQTTVVVPDPAWGNYRQIFGTRRGARILPWRVLDGDRVDVDGLRRTLAGIEGKAVLVLNFPGNPTGFTPALDEAAGIVDAVRATRGPLVVVTDDAYAGLVYEPDRMVHSLFHALLDLDAPILPVKVDGATKELSFFGGRVAFLTFGAEGDAAAVLDEKATAIARATISFSPTLSQQLVLEALRDPDLDGDTAAILELMRRRYVALRAALDAHGLRGPPFNSGLFAMIYVDEPEALRQRLLAIGVGVVALPEAGALRLSFGSVPEDQIPRLVALIAEHAR